MKSKTFLVSLAIFAVILVPFVLFGARADAAIAGWVERAQGYRWLTAGILSGILAADIVAPVPSSLVSTACGALLGFWWGLAVSFIGMTTGCVAGYFMAYAARGKRGGGCESPSASRLHRLYERHGVLMLVALRPVPMLAEASVLFAGAMRMPKGKAMAAMFAGNLAVSAAYAGMGALGLSHGAFLAAFGASILLAGALMFRSFFI